MTLLIASIAEADLDGIREAAARAREAGADAVELRVDAFRGDLSELSRWLAADGKRPWIITCRSTAEGGHAGATAAERARLLADLAAHTEAWIDFEWSAWSGGDDATLRATLAAPREATGGARQRLILSSHDPEHTPADIRDMVASVAREAPGAVAKVATEPSDICDNFVALDILHDAATPVTALCMGEEGLMSRVLAKKLGGFGSYAALSPETATAPGQPTLRDLKTLYRWDTIDASTRVYGVIGDPIAHSMSPVLFARWFAEAGINAVYLPFRVRRGGDCLERFLDGCLARPWLNIGGFSITIPHKQGALQYLDVAADRASASIGAVNTIALKNGDYVGHNTDCYAAIEPVADALGCALTEMKDLGVDVLGTGGAARAVLAGLWALGCRLTLYGRSPQTTAELAAAFHCTPAAWEDRTRGTGEVVINCTSLGMWPEVDATPMPADALTGRRLVYDLVYNPLQTRLLKEAAAHGAGTLSGLEMFVGQAAMQFERWIGRRPDLDLGRDTVEREIRRRAGQA